VRRKSFADMSCPIARTLEIVGDWWTLLIVRDALVGSRRFEEFRETGIADNILSARLDLLVREGILDRQAYQEHPPRFEYVLTEKGHDLLPVIYSLGMWGIKWVDMQARPPSFVHVHCGKELQTIYRCDTCGEALAPREIRVERRAAVPVPMNGRDDRGNQDALAATGAPSGAPAMRADSTKPA
jgi:DNA-binding HxlR family transcriptional regulator